MESVGPRVVISLQSATPRCYICLSQGRTTPGLGVSSFRYRILREGYSVESVGPRVVISLQVQHRGVTFIFLKDVQLLVLALAPSDTAAPKIREFRYRI